MRFSTWLFEQVEDASSPSYKIAKVCWDDVNNGCGSATYNEVQWLDHFTVKHNSKLDLLAGLIFKAHMDFITAVKKLDK